MSGTTKVLLVVGTVAAVGGLAFWAYKKHPEWFKATVSQNPNQVNPGAGGNSKLADNISASSKALDSLTNAYHSFLD